MTVSAGARMSAGVAALVRTVAAGSAALSAGRWLGATLVEHAPGGSSRWARRNHRGHEVTLLEGPSVALAAAVGTLTSSSPWRAAALTAVLGSAAFGALDDLGEADADRAAGARGLRGHLHALRRGRLTTGAWKVLGIGATGLAAAAVSSARAPRHAVGFLDVLLGGALVAGSANLVNLFDLRPGRALKVSAVTALSLGVGSPGGSTGVLPTRPLAGAVLGTVVASLPEDLAGRSMLGDTGANALGALLGVAALARWRRPGRAAALAVVLGLTLASERISFSR
ncbi:MAG: hypothetical protein ACRYF3_02595, partial [Janthinobacterium lividum]